MRRSFSAISVVAVFLAALAQLVLSQLGGITGWMAASPSALTGGATLAVR